MKVTINTVWILLILWFQLPITGFWVTYYIASIIQFCIHEFRHFGAIPKLPILPILQLKQYWTAVLLLLLSLGRKYRPMSLASSCSFTSLLLYTLLAASTNEYNAFSFSGLRRLRVTQLSWCIVMYMNPSFKLTAWSNVPKFNPHHTECDVMKLPSW